MLQPPVFPTVLHIAHCIFPSDGRMVHWVNNNPEGVYETLPQLFVASIMKDVQSGRVVAGCCLFATDLEQESPDFKEKLLHIIESVAKLNSILEEKPRLICVQLIKPENALSEISIERLLADQYIKRGVGGRG